MRLWPFGSGKKEKTMRRRFRPERRSIQGALGSRLTADWVTQPLSMDAEMLPGLRTLRARSRDLAVNNDYARRFLNLVKSNVIGPQGILLQNKAREADGSYDKAANTKIEEAWKAWGKKGICTRCGKLSWVGLQNLVLESAARDGEVLIIKTTDRKNPFGFSLQVLEADYLDENLNREASGGRNAIKGGVEVNSFGQPVAYHLLAAHPGDSGPLVSRRKYRRLPAGQVIHLFRLERAEQTRGLPWLTTPSYRLKMLDGYEEAELVASRTEASKMGFFISPDGEGYTGDDYETDGDPDSAPISEAEPGTFEQLPTGMDFKAWDPQHPVTAFADFEKAILRGIASGLNVSYVDLANDLEGVSYSSIRQGELSARDHYRALQRWFIDNFISEVYREWLWYALLSNELRLPAGKLDKFNRPTWLGRGWSWVDPQKEIDANIEAVKHGFKSLSTVVGEQGYDIEDVFDSLAKEKELAREYGLILPVFGGVKNGSAKEEAGTAGAQPVA